jgi:uncharacterized metal-binding protein YceD (DUF177 family)
MKIGFSKVGSTPVSFEISKEKVEFSGTLVKNSRSLIQLEAQITGQIELPCDACAEEFENTLNESVQFYLSDGIYKNDDEYEHDVVEVEHSMIDLEEILESEIELYKSGYFNCEKCKTK